MSEVLQIIEGPSSDNLKFVSWEIKEYLFERYTDPTLAVIPRFFVLAMVKPNSTVPPLDDRFTVTHYSSFISIISEPYETPSYEALYKDFEYIETQWADYLVEINGINRPGLRQIW